MPIVMRTADAVPILKAACRKPFGELFKGHPADLITNKGHTGQLLERFIGLRLGNQLIDFEDGELKTNKTASNGEPMETIAVTQIKGVVDQLLSDPPREFAGSSVCKKLANLIVVPVVKAGECADWYFLDVYHIDMRANDELRRQFEEDYLTICHELRQKVELVGKISTTNGKYLQIRSKDSKPYNPIHSSEFGRQISSKNYAFYLQKSFVRDILRKAIS